MEKDLISNLFPLGPAFLGKRTRQNMIKRAFKTVCTRSIFFLLLLFSGNIYSQTSGNKVSDQVMTVATRFISQHAENKNYSVLYEEEISLSDNHQVYLVHLSPVGFLLISDTVTNQVLAFSFKNDFAKILSKQKIVGKFLEGALQGGKVKHFKQNLTECLWGPFVQTLWGQVNCYDQNNNLINVTNYYTPHHYAAGCVAIAMGQVMRYYKWPRVGTGSYTYSDTYGGSKGTYSADFSQAYYQWGQMLNRYKYRRSTDEERKAVGQLVFDVAVALSTDFEHNGSTSNVNRIPAAGGRFFRYSAVERKPSSKIFWQLMDTNMVYGIPVVLAVKTSNGAGHAVVCDGLKIDDNGNYYYHLNMGWWGSSNGWYLIRGQWNAGGYTSITDGVFYLLPIPQLVDPDVKEGQKKVNITWYYPDKAAVQAFELQEKTGDNGNWVSISDSIQDTVFQVDVKAGEKQYFRLRAKVAGRWPYDEWSNEVILNYDTLSGVERLKDDDLRLFPNPSSKKIFVQCGRFLPEHLQVFNLLGKKVLQKENLPQAKQFVLNIESLQQGCYILKLINQNNDVKIIKFVKR